MPLYLYLVDELANKVGGGAHVNTRRIGVLHKSMQDTSVYMPLFYISDASTATYLWYTWQTAWNWLLSLIVISAKVCKLNLRWGNCKFHDPLYLEVAFFNCLQNLLSSRRNAVFSSVLRDKTMTESQALLSSFHPNWHIGLELPWAIHLFSHYPAFPHCLGCSFYCHWPAP